MTRLAPRERLHRVAARRSEISACGERPSYGEQSHAGSTPSERPAPGSSHWRTVAAVCARRSAVSLSEVKMTMGRRKAWARPAIASALAGSVRPESATTENDRHHIFSTSLGSLGDLPGSLNDLRRRVAGDGRNRDHFTARSFN